MWRALRRHIGGRTRLPSLTGKQAGAALLFLYSVPGIDSPSARSVKPVFTWPE
jgi:hypothetical protein